jgi:hypothetical protein
LQEIRKGRYLANPIDRLIDLLPDPARPRNYDGGVDNLGIAFNPYYVKTMGEEYSA